MTLPNDPKNDAVTAKPRLFVVLCRIENRTSGNTKPHPQKSTNIALAVVKVETQSVRTADVMWRTGKYL
jgi:hypothetical protein